MAEKSYTKNSPVQSLKTAQLARGEGKHSSGQTRLQRLEAWAPLPQSFPKKPEKLFQRELFAPIAKEYIGQLGSHKWGLGVP